MQTGSRRSMNRALYRKLMAASLGLLLAACGGGGGDDSGDSSTPPSGSCTETSAKQFVLNVARDWYLFPDLLPASVNIGNYATASELLDALTAQARTQKIDRDFSYVTTRQADQAQFQGQNAGFGFRLRDPTDQRLFLVEVFETAPAAAAGFTRGTEIVAIDAGSGYRSIASWLSTDPKLSEALGLSNAGVSRGFQYRLPGESNIREITIVKAEYDLDPIADTGGVRVLPLTGTAGVGYLNFRSFISTASDDLPAAFDQFRQRGLTDFVIDLRYNGGGLVRIEEQFASLLGAALDGRLAQTQEFNSARGAAENESYSFDPQPQSVAPVRIAFITSDRTASASELLINTMKPYVQVAIVGANTYGKPVGQSGFGETGCDTLLRLITFRTVNSLNEGDYYDGLASRIPDACAAADDIGHAMGDPAESSTAAALSWLSSGSCPAGLIASTGSSKTLRPESPSLMRSAAPADELNPGIY